MIDSEGNSIQLMTGSKGNSKYYCQLNEPIRAQSHSRSCNLAITQYVARGGQQVVRCPKSQYFTAPPIGIALTNQYTAGQELWTITWDYCPASSTTYWPLSDYSEVSFMSCHGKCTTRRAESLGIMP